MWEFSIFPPFLFYFILLRKKSVVNLIVKHNLESLYDSIKFGFFFDNLYILQTSVYTK